jgi:hypothetical protein
MDAGQLTLVPAPANPEFAFPSVNIGDSGDICRGALALRP